MKQSETVTEPRPAAAPAQAGGDAHGAGHPHSSSPSVPPPGPAGKLPFVILAIIFIALGVMAAVRLVDKRAVGKELAKDTAENAIPTVSIIHPKRTPVDVQIELPGNITAFEESPLYARVSGYLKYWLTDIGTRVTNGQPLAAIDTPELDQQLSQANASLAQAKANLAIAKVSADRWQKLRETDSVSQQDTDTRVATWHAQEASVNAAEADVKRLQELTNFKMITAPFSGIITERTMDAGTLITAGGSREIFRLARMDPLRVYVSVPQAYSQLIKTNDNATLTFTEMPGETFTGVIDRTAGAIDPASRTLLTEILVTNTDGKLFPGAHVTVHLHLAQQNVPVIIPVNTLLFRDEAGMQVGVVESNDTVRLARVTVGHDYGTNLEIVLGVSESDSLIVNPSDSLVNGAKVRVEQPKPEDSKPKHE